MLVTVMENAHLVKVLAGIHATLVIKAENADIATVPAKKTAMIATVMDGYGTTVVHVMAPVAILFVMAMMLNVRCVMVAVITIKKIAGRAMAPDQSIATFAMEVDNVKNAVAKEQ